MSDDILDLAAARAQKNRDILGDDKVSESFRIVNLAMQHAPTFGSAQSRELVEKWTQKLCRPGVKNPRPLLEAQAWAFEVMHAQAQRGSPVGLAGNLGVGSGKTLLDMLAGHPAIFAAQRTVVLTKSSLIEELQQERMNWSKDYAIPHFQPMSYGALSSKKGTSRLSIIRPDLIVCDEAHLLRYLDSARTGRFVRYFNENPQTRLVVITGTFMSTSLRDMLHLLFLALREGSPAPHPESIEAQTWASCIDEDSEPHNKDFYDLDPLVRWSGRELGDSGDVEKNKEICRVAFFDRLATTPGFVFTTAASCSAEMTITADHSVDTRGVIDSALKELVENNVLPNGEDVIDAFAMARAARQLSMGFYMRWAWERSPSGEQDVAWMDARKGWAAACRWWLKATCREGMDSPGLIQDAIVRGDPVHPELVDAWARWSEQRHKPEPPTDVVWLDMAPLVHAYSWLQDKRNLDEPALLWWESTSAIRPVLESLGVRTYGAGDSGNALRKETVAAPSQKVFGTGFNGQRFTHHFILEPPANPGTLEQLLGRSHRTGREEPVHITVAQWAWPLRVAWNKAYRRSVALQDIMGQQQRVLHATLSGFSQEIDEEPLADFVDADSI